MPGARRCGDDGRDAIGPWPDALKRGSYSKYESVGKAMPNDLKADRQAGGCGAAEWKSPVAR